MAGAIGKPLRHQVTAYAALVRVPNLFTAPPDVLLGAALAVAGGGRAVPADVAVVAVASTLLYAGGTTLNDYFDAPIDAHERPERPIPSGRVGRRSALALGAALLVAGVLAAATATVGAGLVAAAIALVVVLYDGALKGGPAGFLAMGSARGLNVLLGAGALGLATLSSRTIGVAAVIAGYIATVTFMAAEETTGGDRLRVGVAAAGAATAGVATLAVVVFADGWVVATGLGIVLAAAFLVWTGRALTAAYADPVPETVGPAVGACVLGLVILDAALAAVAGVRWALVTLAFLVPAVGLATTFDVS